MQSPRGLLHAFQHPIEIRGAGPSSIGPAIFMRGPSKRPVSILARHSLMTAREVILLGLARKFL